MRENPQVGQKVRVMLEGEVTSIHLSGFTVGHPGTGGQNHIRADAKHVTSVEVLSRPVGELGPFNPLADYPVGTVVVNHNTFAAVAQLRPSGLWRRLDQPDLLDESMFASWHDPVVVYLPEQTT